MIHYFITTNQDFETTSIERAQIKRAKLFSDLKQQSRVIELKYNFDHKDVQDKLNFHNVINIYQYFQKLKYGKDNQKTIEEIVQKNNFEVRDNTLLKENKIRAQWSNFKGQLYVISYFDQFGFLDRREYFDQGCLTFVEYYDDRGKLMTRVYKDNENRDVIVKHYHGGENDKAVLCLVEVNYEGIWYQYDRIEDFYGYFFDILNKNGEAVFYSDRSSVALPAFKSMKTKANRYMVFHSTFTINAHPNGSLYDQYKDIPSMLEEGKLTGLICSTKKEAQDLSQRFNTKKVYAIPVAYINRQDESIKFKDRKPYSIISVARLDKVKQLDHIIKAAIILHHKFPKLTLDFYGSNTTSNGTKTYQKLEKLIKDNNADRYIKFKGYVNDIDTVYKKAWLQVITSEFEGFCMAILEAQSFSCPTISYDVNYGPSEIIENGKTGYLIKKNAQDELIRRIDSTFTNFCLLKKFSKTKNNKIVSFKKPNVKASWKNFLNKENIFK